MEDEFFRMIQGHIIPENENFEIENYAGTDHSMTFENGNVHPLFLEDKLKWIREIMSKDWLKFLL